MLYITMADITGMIPVKFLTEAFDDDGDGLADQDVIGTVFDTACRAVDSILEGRYGAQIPFQNPIPAVIIQASKVFACELLYQRRGKSAEDNPFTKQANQYRDPQSGILTKIAAGEMPLTPNLQRSKPSATAITQPSALGSRINA